jgi:hypothetical protein
MADIFLSYKREDVDQARPLVAVLEAAGWTVFWDPEILSGDRWAAVLDRELQAASCVVVLWSHRSVGSDWVRREAASGHTRGVLLPVRLDRIEPPDPFRHLQATSLMDWNGEAGAHAIQTLLRAIDELIGRVLSPVDLNLVTGDRARWGELGPTVNMGCRLDNRGRRPLALNRLELAVARGGESAYELAWHLFYTSDGLEHLKAPYEERITVEGHAAWQRGVQFRSTRSDVSNVWPAGAYEFELLGWVSCRPAESRANVRTTFRAVVDQRTSSTMARWRGASVEEWTAQEASDRALGFPLHLTDVTTRQRRGRA